MARNKKTLNQVLDECRAKKSALRVEIQDILKKMTTGKNVHDYAKLSEFNEKLTKLFRKYNKLKETTKATTTVVRI